MFQRAQRKQVYLRMMLLGVSGSGKTYSALGIARGLAGDTGKIAVLDSERGSSRLYSDAFPFDVAEVPDIEVGNLGRPDGRYAPERYMAGIHAAERAGYSVLVIDSLTHAWNGEGGVQDIVDWATQSKFKGNSYAAWSIATPIWRQLLDTIIAARLHVIVTGRSKAEWLEQEKNGRKTFERVGTKAELRDGAEYELDLVGELDVDHNLRIHKTRYSALVGQVITRPGRDFGRRLHEWLRGERPQEASVDDIGKRLYQVARVDIPTAAAFCEMMGRPAPALMLPEQREKFFEYLAGEEGKGRLERWLFDTRRPRVTSPDPHGWPAEEAATLYRSQSDGASAPATTPAPAAQSPHGDTGAPTTATPTARPASTPPAAGQAPATAPAPASGQTITAEQVRGLLAAIRTERQSLGDEVFIQTCRDHGIDPVRYATSGGPRLQQLLAALRAAAGADDAPSPTADDAGATGTDAEVW